MTQNPFGGNSPRSYSTLIHDGLSVEVHSPVATKSHYVGDQEVVGGLASSARVSLYKVDDFDGAPENWQRSDARFGLESYFMLAKPGHMVWFDLNRNYNDAHHIAAVISAQGVNALTGQILRQPILLEQYPERCPVHHQSLRSNRHCDSCGYTWPHQNYISTTSVGQGQFWRDGFCAEDGQTREFMFTEDADRGVAAQIMGNARVPAFGIGLYRSHNPKPQASRMRGMRNLESLETPRGFESHIEVAAGALVKQEAGRDPNGLDFWKRDPDAVFIIYYVGQRQFEAILASGVRRTNSFLGGRGGNP